MLWNDALYLVTVVESTDKYGELIKTTTKKLVSCDVLSATRSEFYQAQTAGYKPEKVFLVRTAAYENEPYVEHAGITYTVIRAYSKDGEVSELVCERGVREVGRAS